MVLVIFILWIPIVVTLPLTSLSQDDPCKNYRMLYDDGGRSINCDRYYSKSHDRFIAEGWRRVQLQPTGEDLTMPTQCVPNGYCGSHSNVWLNGTHPTVEDGIVDRKGCLSTFSSCCKVQYPIQIKNCTDYMVYNLMRTFGSDERYCFGDSTRCHKTSSTTSTTTKTSPPTILYSTTKASPPTILSSTTKKSRPNTVSSTTDTSRLTTLSSSTDTIRPISKTSLTSTKYEPIATVQMNPEISADNNHQNSQKINTVHDHKECVSDNRDYGTGEMVLIFGGWFLFTITIFPVFCIFFILIHRKQSKKHSKDSSTSTNPAFYSTETQNDNMYDFVSPYSESYNRPCIYLTPI